MLVGSIVVFACGAGIGALLAPHALRSLHEKSWVFADGMRWYGWRFDPTKVLRWLVIAAGATGVLTWAWLGSYLIAAASAVTVCVSPGWILTAVQARRRKRFNAQFVDVLLLMANSLRAGFNLSQALQIIANEMPSPAKDEFALLIMDRDLGSSMENALESLGRRMKSDSMSIFVTAILVTMQTGGDVARMLDKLVRTIRDRERVEDRVRTMTAEGRLQGYVVATVPVLLFAAVYVFSSDSVRAMLSTPWGSIAVLLGLVLNALGLLVIRNMSKVKV